MQKADRMQAGAVRAIWKALSDAQTAKNGRIVKMPRRVSEGKKANWRLIIGVVLFVTLLFSIGYALINYFGAPEQAQEGVKSRSDYALMLTQCLLGVVVMFLPSIIQKKWSVAIPNYMYVCYFVFLYCAIYLGEVRNFYYLIPNWDTILHGFSAVSYTHLGTERADRGSGKSGQYQSGDRWI